MVLKLPCSECLIRFILIWFILHVETPAREQPHGISHVEDESTPNVKPDATGLYTSWSIKEANTRHHQLFNHDEVLD